MTLSAFNIIGPSMVGPSSSHTAGALKLGRFAGSLLNFDIKKIQLALHGSFAETGKGHATDKALVAGIIGLNVDDASLKDSFEIAGQKDIEFNFKVVDLGEDAHPNSVEIILSNANHSVSMLGSSIGGGMISIQKIDGLATNLDGELPTLVIWHRDHVGFLSKLTGIIACLQINIASIRTSRSERGKGALTTMEVDSPLANNWICLLAEISYVDRVVQVFTANE